MTDAKPKYANFPTNDPKVIIGANINAATTKTLTRMSIGTYEMCSTVTWKQAMRILGNEFSRRLVLMSIRQTLPMPCDIRQTFQK